jgi:PIN domain nuclease of toxin-antitoxin system
MRVLLDTNIFIKASTEGIGALSKATRRVVEDPETERYLSSISTGEIAIKTAVGKLNMNSDEVLKAA